MSNQSLIGSAFSLALLLVNFTSKYISRSIVGVPRYLILSARCSVSLMILLPIIMFYAKPTLLHSNNIRLQIFRSMLTSTVILMTYIGYEYLPLGIAGGISACEPIFVALWSLILGFETRKSIIILFPIVILGICGMLLMLNIGTGFSTKYILPSLALLLANICCAYSHFLSNKVSKYDRHSTTLVYNVIFTCCLMLALNVVLGFFGISGDFAKLSGSKLQLIALGVFAMILSRLGLEANQRLNPNMHVAIQNMSLPLSILIGYFLEGERITSNSIVATAVILLTIYLLRIRSKNRNRAKIILCVTYVLVGSYYISISIQGRQIEKKNHGCPCCH